MNNFTKEELDYIRGALGNFILWHCYTNPIKIEELLDKVKSMIDNYCEHEHVYDPGLPQNCRKCGVY